MKRRLSMAPYLKEEWVAIIKLLFKQQKNYLFTYFDSCFKWGQNSNTEVS